MTRLEPELSVVVPVFREAARLTGLLESIVRHLEQTGADFEILVIDDGSPDDTWAEIERLAADHPQVIGVRLTRNFGKESALCAGVERARGRATRTPPVPRTAMALRRLAPITPP